MIDITPLAIAIVIIGIGWIAVQVAKLYEVGKEWKPDIFFQIEEAARFGVRVAQTLKDAGAFAEYEDDLTNYVASIELRAKDAAGLWLKEHKLKVDFDVLEAAIRAQYQAIIKNK